MILNSDNFNQFFSIETLETRLSDFIVSFKSFAIDMYVRFTFQRRNTAVIIDVLVLVGTAELGLFSSASKGGIRSSFDSFQ